MTTMTTQDQRLVKVYTWLYLIGGFCVAAIAAYASWSHMVGVALRFGERSDVAHLLPISVDGLLLVSLALMALDKLNGYRPRISAIVNTGIGATASVVANVAHAHPTPGARVIAAWPAVALFLAAHMIAGRGRALKRIAATIKTPPAVAAPVKPAPAPLERPTVPATPEPVEATMNPEPDWTDEPAATPTPAAARNGKPTQRINRAARQRPDLDPEQIAQLAGVTPRHADRILRERTQEYPFRAPYESNGDTP